MTRSLLFGYSVAREAGKVIVTIEGSMAGEVMSSLSGQKNFAGIPFPFGPLGSPSMGLTSFFMAEDRTGADDAEKDIAPSLADVFGQGFDRSYDEYEARLAAYREILAADSSSPAHGPESGDKLPQERELDSDRA